MLTIWSSVTGFFDIVVAHWVTHAVAAFIGWHLLPQPGYMGRLWGRIKAAFGKVFS